MKDITSKGADHRDEIQATPPVKPVWEKPEITDFQSISVARGGGGVNPGDGFSNLT
ncbi:MAG TPA: hypothetical protein VN137_01735 [Sphingomonas sp.]|nr:hypothetical protein [Sphingomonas sp.]